MQLLLSLLWGFSRMIQLTLSRWLLCIAHEVHKERLKCILTSDSLFRWLRLRWHFFCKLTQGCQDLKLSFWLLFGNCLFRSYNLWRLRWIQLLLRWGYQGSLPASLTREYAGWRVFAPNSEHLVNLDLQPNTLRLLAAVAISDWFL